jgi:cytochrome P450
MRALFGFDPDSARAGETAMHFERGLAFHGAEFVAQLLVGPGTPYAKLVRARRALERTVGAEIASRRRSGEDRGDVLGSLLAARDEDGRALTDRQVLDHVMTLLFAGHDTTTSTVTFLVLELARNPGWAPRLAGHLDEALGTEAAPSPEQLVGGGLPLLSQAIDETLRMYPPAWIGPRRAVRDFEFAGVGVPAGLCVAYSSWVSHHLPDVWEEPREFRPERFEPENRSRLPRGAYVPFGMGPRVCIGRRFGYTEVHAIGAALVRRFAFELPPGHRVKIEQSPTLAPKGGLPVRLLPRN